MPGLQLCRLFSPSWRAGMAVSLHRLHPPLHFAVSMHGSTQTLLLKLEARSCMPGLANGNARDTFTQLRSVASTHSDVATPFHSSCCRLSAHKRPPDYRSSLIAFEAYSAKQTCAEGAPPYRPAAAAVAMPKSQPPELKKFMDKKLTRKPENFLAHASATCLACSSLRCSVPAVILNRNRQVTGVLRGFDQFMNIVLDSTVDEKAKSDIGMVV